MVDTTRPQPRTPRPARGRPRIGPVVAVLVAAVTFLTATLAAATVAAPVADAAPRPAENGSVERLYRAYLLRDPDPSGLTYWSEQYLSCAQPLGRISEFFATSPEFQNRYGTLSNRQFIELIYTNVLGRTGEPSGVDYWTSRLDTGTPRGLVMIGFSESAEYVARTGTAAPEVPLCVSRGVSDSVYRLYRSYLLREPDPGGERYWALEYAQCRRSLVGISEFFASSPEFQNRYGTLSNRQFVDLVYANVLGRVGEPSGVDYWTSRLDGGVARGLVMVGFSESAEYVTATGTVAPAGTGCPPLPDETPPPPPPGPTPTGPTGGLTGGGYGRFDTNALLNQLTVTAESSRSGYDRDLFRHWSDLDGNGCDTRQDVLRAESLTPVAPTAGCPVTAGTWLSIFDNVTVTVPGSLDVDHLVPLAEAWDSGAHAWTSTRRQQYANDVTYAGSLVAVTASTNRSKGDDDPAGWTPPNRAAWCLYAYDWVTVKVRWQLTADPAEVNALRTMLAGCG